MAETYPLVPLYLEQGVGIALSSYVGRLFWGFNADRDVAPDADRLAELVGEAFDELE
ncbi:MAG: WS/DGAT domain-containing protein [Myxococcota bacterium]